MVNRILRVEGLVFLIASIYFYNLSSGSWLLFVLLLFVPDISMMGYLKDKGYGAKLYNGGHNYILVVALIAIGIFLDASLLIHIGLILMAHVSLDRMLGFGLKYPKSFRETHMQKV